MPEFSAHAGLIARVFRAGLGRPPDGFALQSFAAMLRDGAGLMGVARAVASSAEFRAVHGAEDICSVAYVTTLFRNAFDRDPDIQGLATITTLGSRAEALAVVAGSDEARETIKLLGELYPDGATPTDVLGYPLWVEQREALEEEDRIAIGRQIDAMAAPPRFSLLMIAAFTRPDLLEETVQSLSVQLYPNWELCIACTHNLPRMVRGTIERIAAGVPGVRLVDTDAGSGIGDLWQAALQAAGGDVVAFLDAGDRLAVTALYEMAAALAASPTLDLLYSDEDSIAENGERSEPLLKPGWSPDALLAGDVVGQLAVMRRARVLAVGGIRADAGGQARYDLLLRLTHDMAPGAIAHVPDVLFHRGRQPGRKLPFPRSRATTSHPDVVQAVARHLRETGRDVEVGDVYIGGDVWPRVTYPRPAKRPRVSVLIPTCDQPKLLAACVSGLLERTAYPDLEILIADNGSETAAASELFRRLARDSRVHVEAIDIRFNWSALNNRLAAHATGDVLVLMNDDVEVIGPDWLDEIVRQISREGVGIVGARLLYPDRTLQHGGMVLSEMAATHVLRSSREEEPGYLGQLTLTRDLSAVTGACLAIRRSLFAALEGADESFDHTCNDVDLCLRARAAGWRVVWTPHAVLVHVDGATRGHDKTMEQLTRFWHDLSRLHERWGEAMDYDPFLNANLVATDHSLVLSPVPRRKLPWAELRETVVEEARLRRRGREVET